MKPYGYTELLENIVKLKDVYDEKVCVSVAGTSVKGRILPFLRIGNKGKKLLAVGTVHGREFVTSAFLMRSVEELLASCEEFSCSLFVLPMLNPDGAEIALLRDKSFSSELFKNNARNINLNANFPFYFSKVPKKRQGGKTAASEPEVKALIGLCEREKFFSAISLHARGNCIFWRDFGNGAVQGDLELARAFETKCGFKLVTPTKNAEDYAGGFENWFRCRYRRPALCIELVENEEIKFSDMCECFDEAVIWEKTGNLLKTYINSAKV